MRSHQHHIEQKFDQICYAQTTLPSFLVIDAHNGSRAAKPRYRLSSTQEHCKRLTGPAIRPEGISSLAWVSRRICRPFHLWSLFAMTPTTFVLLAVTVLNTVPVVRSLTDYANDFLNPTDILTKNYTHTHLAQQTILQWASDSAAGGPWSMSCDPSVHAVNLMSQPLNSRYQEAISTSLW